jgi:hypothetical protein
MCVPHDKQSRVAKLLMIENISEINSKSIQTIEISKQSQFAL